MKISRHETVYEATYSGKSLQVYEETFLNEKLFIFSTSYGPKMIIRAPRLERAKAILLDLLPPIPDYGVPDAYGFRIFVNSENEWVLEDEIDQKTLLVAKSSQAVTDKAMKIITGNDRPLVKGYYYQRTPKATGIVYIDPTMIALRPLDQVQDSKLQLDIRSVAEQHTTLSHYWKTDMRLPSVREVEKVLTHLQTSAPMPVAFDIGTDSQWKVYDSTAGFMFLPDKRYRSVGLLNVNTDCVQLASDLLMGIAVKAALDEL